MWYKYVGTFLSLCHNSRVWQTDRHFACGKTALYRYSAKKYCLSNSISRLYSSVFLWQS